MTLWLTLLGMGLITYAMRLSLILLAQRVALSDALQRALRYVPPAVLAAIIAPELLQPGGALDLSLGNARLLAGLLAIGAAWWSKNVLVTVALGMLALWLLQLAA
jgi:branched-subunit amino acid transport protein